MKNAVQTYHAQNPTYPEAEDDLVPSFLEEKPDNVAITYRGAATKPSLAWGGADVGSGCTAATTGEAAP